MKRIFISFLIVFAIPIYAQNKFTLSGYIKEKETGEVLLGANLVNKSIPTQGVSSNIYGFFSITLPEGKYTMVASYIGYQNKEIEVNLTQSQTVNIELSQGIEIQEVEIKSKKENENVTNTDMGTVTLQQEEIKKIPALMGEVDILKVIQLLPGVMSAGEGSSGFYVRGGGADQNLILLDEATVYNSGHLFGFFSVFNNDAIKNTTLIKGGMPAQYGGRLSSVLDLTMKDGNNQRFGAEGGIGLISSRLTLEAPIIKNKSSFILSGRRTYAFDLAQPALNKGNFAGTNYYFFDLNTKVNYKFNDKNRLFLSGYFGRDVFLFASKRQAFDLSIPWGNATLSARWNHVYNEKLFSNVSLIYQDYNFKFKGAQGDAKFQLFSGVKDVNTKVDFDYFLNNKNTIKFGANYTFHQFKPNIASFRSDDFEVKPTDSVRYAMEGGLYVQDEIKFSAKLSANIGARLSWFRQLGPYEYIGNNRDTVVYDKYKKVVDYVGVEPRANFNYLIDEVSSVKVGITRNIQYMHLVSQSNSTLPTDLWIPSSQKIKPQISWQYAVGYFRNFADNQYEASVEAYYKQLKQQIDYTEDFVQDIGLNYENSFVFGSGKAYGIEFFVKKRTGKLNGWIGYTLSNSPRTFLNINAGKAYPTKFDRRHDLKVVANYTISKKWELGATFVFGTGAPVTLPVSTYTIENALVNEYGERNWYRMPDYHRLDIGATYYPSKKLWGKIKHDIAISVYNVYNRRNPYFMYTKVEGDIISQDVKITGIQVSLFPVIPSVTWNFKF